MKDVANLFWYGLLSLICGCQTQSHSNAVSSSSARAERLKSWRAQNPVWRGVHLMMDNDAQLAALGRQLPKLAADGVNVLVLQVDYSFDFKSHPELRSPQYVTEAGAREFAAAAHELGIRVIPELDCLGHQSWSTHTLPLLLKYPKFDETPGQFPDNKGIYCRSWCPQNPDVNQVVFALIDELTDAFDADAFHVGMDEVFIIASEHCPRCRGGDPAKLFAKAVNDLHKHIVGRRKLEMLMWADRLLDSKARGYSEWEASANGTAGAVDLIPKDIILCDWHYVKYASYPSVPLLLNKGFRVWPSSWQPLADAMALSEFCQPYRENARLLGLLCTTWGKVKTAELADWPPLTEVMAGWK